MNEPQNAPTPSGTPKRIGVQKLSVWNHRPDQRLIDQVCPPAKIPGGMCTEAPNDATPTGKRSGS